MRNLWVSSTVISQKAFSKTVSVHLPQVRCKWYFLSSQKIQWDRVGKHFHTECLNRKKTLNLSRPMIAGTQDETYKPDSLPSPYPPLTAPQLHPLECRGRTGDFSVVTSQGTDLSANRNISCGPEKSPLVPEDVLMVMCPVAKSFSSLWTHSCRFALSCSKAWTILCSVLIEALSLSSSASCEEDNP